MSVRREALRRLRLEWPVVLVIAVSWIGGLSLEAEASWFPQDAGVAPVDSEAPTTSNADQAAVVAQDDEGSGSSESLDANAESAGVDADASGDGSEGTPTPRDAHGNGEVTDAASERPMFVIPEAFRVGRDEDGRRHRQLRNDRRSWEAKRPIRFVERFVWVYPLFLALWFGRSRLLHGKWPKMNFVLKMLSVGWLLCVMGLLITARMS